MQTGNWVLERHADLSAVLIWLCYNHIDSNEHGSQEDANLVSELWLGLLYVFDLHMWSCRSTNIKAQSRITVSFSVVAMQARGSFSSSFHQSHVFKSALHWFYAYLFYDAEGRLFKTGILMMSSGFRLSVSLRRTIQCFWRLTDFSG